MNETARRHTVYGAYQERSRFGADLTTGKKILLNFFTAVDKYDGMSFLDFRAGLQVP